MNNKNYDDWQDTFPPNRWLKKTIMKTPLRFATFILGLIALEFICMWLFPHATAVVATYLLMVWMIVAVPGLVWWVVWMFRNPPPKPPPPRQCPTCHQYLPRERDNG